MTRLRVLLCLVLALEISVPLGAQQVVGLTVKPAAVRVAIGATAGLEVSLVRANGVSARPRQGTLRFASSDTLVAAVDSSGRVTGRSAGITVLTVSYETVQRNVPVTVSGSGGVAAASSTDLVGAPPPAAVRRVRALRVRPDTLRLLPTERGRYTLEVEFEDGGQGTASGLSIAVFGNAARLDSAANEVVGVAEGSAVLGVRVTDGPSVSVPISVVAATLGFDRDTLFLAVGSFDTVRVNTMGADARRLTTGLAWRSTNRMVVQPLDSMSGAMQAVAGGGGDLVVDGYGVTMRLPVVTFPAIATLKRAGATREDVVLPLGLDTPLGITAISENGAEVRGAPIRWEMADSSIATYDRANQRLIARRLGSTTLSVRAPGVATTSWRVNVVPARFVLDWKQPYLVEGDTRPLRAHWIGPAGDTLRSTNAVRWSSSNTRIVSVNDSGRVQGEGSGDARIAAQFDERYQAEVTVRVTADFLATLVYTRDSVSVAQISLANRRITPVPNLRGARSASWSWQRDRVAFARTDDARKRLAIFVANTSSGATTPLSTAGAGDEFSPEWLGDGTRIAYLAGKAGDARVVVQRIGDSLAATWLPRGRIHDLARRPGRDEFLAVTEDDGRFSVWSLTERDSSKRVVDRRRGAIERVQSLGDGSILMIADTSSGKNRFALVRVQAGQETTVPVELPADIGRLRTFAVSADGQQAVLVADHPKVRQGCVVFSVNLRTSKVEEIIRTEQYRVLFPTS